MPSAPRATIVQLDPYVPADRLGQWLAAQRVLVRAVPLWQLPVPELDSLSEGLILLGGRMSAHDQSSHGWIEPLKQLLRDAVAAEVPTLAICLGHQLLAEAFGGEVTVAHAAGGEHGPVQLSWAPEAAADPVLARLAGQGTSMVAESHHDAVTRLPDGAISLAASATYPNQAFRVGSALGVQFHPEASPELMGRWADLDGDDGRGLRRVMRNHDSEVAHTGRLLAQSFTVQLRAGQLAA